ncbi:CIT [Cordylochernes scorpioides]|uniref:non-specific serine/threonine protein kinase n=1 Tax=Cordylochernes scorpioides TaxID=51811 RepID=A0ABY6JZ59_9ARAC|nr:CIT [Cordylochernes scorpioides]
MLHGEMADISQSIPGRQVRLNQLILGKSGGTSLNLQQVSRDSLLDALCALYDELNKESLRKDNKLISSFVDKYRGTLAELRQMRVNIKDFEMKKIIGQGHFGEVRVVREKSSGDVFAMKVLHKNETLSQSNAAFFAEERDIMANAASPWLTKLHHAFQDMQHLYLVMEFHPGGDLLALLEKHRDSILPPETAHFYLAELVEAIHSLHSMGYVHRDIKPDNILIDRIGHVKLADFGSASKLNAQKMVTSRMPVGTPDYIAPEVLIAMNSVPAATASYGVECDWWSLGIVAYEMFYGQMPFSDDRVVVTYNNIMNFKTSLHFPEEPSYPKETISLMKNLLCEATVRADHQALYQHPYFAGVDWPALRNKVPPYVPILKGEDDTSYFDEFEPEPSSPTLEIPKKEFSGKQLPFIGFTFSHPVDTPATR